MHHTQKKISLLLLCFCCFSVVVMASGTADWPPPVWENLTTAQIMAKIFTPVPNDLSMQFIHTIFGISGDGQFVPDTQGVVVTLMTALNLGAIMAAGAVITYSVVASVVRTSQDGGMSSMGKVNGLTLLRVFGGFSILLPYSGQGFSFIQMLILWVVRQGVGLADHVWDQILVQYQHSVGAVQVVVEDNQNDTLIRYLLNGNNVQPKTQENGQYATVSDIASSAMCVATLQYAAQQKCQATKNQDPTCQYSLNQGYTVRYDNGNGACGQRQSLCFGGQDQTARQVCGRYAFPNDMPEEAKSAIWANANRLITLNHAWIEHNLKLRQTAIFSPTSQNIAAAQGAAQCSTRDSQGTTFACMVSNALLQFARQYYLSIKDQIIQKQQTVYASQHNQQGANNIYQSLHEDGWVGAAKAVWMFSSGPSQFGHTKAVCQEPENCLKPFQMAVSSKQQSIQPLLEGMSGSITPQMYEKDDRWSVGFLPAVQQFNVNADQSINPQQEHPDKAQSDAVTANNSKSLDIATAYLLHMLYFDFFQIGLLDDSPFSRGSSCKLCWFHSNLDAAQNNLTVMLVRSFSAFMGFNFYQADGDAMWDNGNNEGNGWRDSISHIKDRTKIHANCGTKKNDACFENLWNNHPGEVIQNNLDHGPLGLLGSIGVITYGRSVVGSEAKNKYYNPLKNIRKMGIALVGISTDFWYYLPQSVLNQGAKMLSKYRGQMITMGWISSALQGLGLLVPDFGVYIAAGLKQVTASLYVVMQMFYQFDVQSLMVFVPLATALTSVFFIAGAILAVWIPLIPFLVFFLAVIGWGISVVEAIVAAPLVAMGLTYPDGHEFLGQSQQSVVLLLGVFVRPVVLLMSFVFGFFLFYVATNLTNIGFVNLLATMLPNIYESSLSARAPAMLALIMCYCYILITVTEFSFATTYKIPEKILIWIGGQPESTPIASKMEKVKRGFKSGAEKGGSGATQNAVGLSPQLPTQKLMKDPQESPKQDGDKGRGSKGIS